MTCIQFVNIQRYTVRLRANITPAACLMTAFNQLTSHSYSVNSSPLPHSVGDLAGVDTFIVKAHLTEHYSWRVSGDGVTILEPLVSQARTTWITSWAFQAEAVTMVN